VRALIAFLIGAVIALSIFYFIKYYFGNPFRLLFYTVEVKNKSFDDVVKTLEDKLNKNGLKVIRVLPLSKALEARGIKDFPKYSIILACDVPGKEKILPKYPALTNLIPCSVAVYQTKEGVKITTMKEIVFLAEYAKQMSDEEANFVINTYRNLRKTLDEVRK